MAQNVWQVFSILLWLLVALPTAYLYALAVASIRQTSVRSRPGVSQRRPDTRFAIVIPAHNEESVIGETVRTLGRLDYPKALFDIHVAADYCTDGTAAAAHAAGAIIHERNEGPRAGKGAVLAWAFERILRPSGMEDGFSPAPSVTGPYRAVVVFDADTRAAPDFLRLMDARFAAGARAVQGQHRISNPGDSWFASLTAAMMAVQNRLQNQGRSNLRLSAFNMGDSICIEATLLRTIGWGVGLTEDYDLRFHLLSSGVRIVYEPEAVGLGEAPASWAVARRQRERWLAGTYRSSRRHRGELLRLAVRRRSPAAWDALLQALFPAYSTLILLAGAGMAAQAVVSRAAAGGTGGMTGLWIALVIALLLYPILGLLLARAPGRAYAAVFLGPVFAVWRTWLALSARFLRRPAVWVRTPRRGLGR